MNIKLKFSELLNKIIENNNLSFAEAQNCMEQIMSGEFTSSQIASLVTALRMKVETIDEIAGFVQAMRQGSLKVPNVPENVVDTCGTGGTKLDTFNISTASAFVAAGAGVIIAKHGNRSASSKSGSADVLESLGVNINISPEKEAAALEKIGISFLFARNHHPALKYAAIPRKEIAVRTIFNLIGPMTNPAGAKTQLMGVFAGVDTSKIAAVLQKLGSERVMVVHGDDGLDEITLTSETEISELKNGEIKSYKVKPEDFGMKRSLLEDVSGGEPDENAKTIREIFEGKSGPKSDIVALNAGAVIYLSGLAKSHVEGVLNAKEFIKSGKVLEKLNELVKFTN